MIDLSNFIGQEHWLSLLRFGLLTLLIYVGVLIAIVVDLISGIKRSKRLGIPVRSYGLRRSLVKYGEYGLPLLLVSLIDSLLFLFTAFELFGLSGLPWFSLLGGIACIIIEIKSVWENTDRNRQREIALAVANLSELARTKAEASEILAIVAKKLQPSNEPSPMPSADAYTRATPDYTNPKREGREDYMHLQNEGERFELR